MLVRTWERETTTDENGNIVVKKEEFVPELDISVKVLDERPTDPNYYTDMAMALLGKAMGIRAFWKTMKDGKFPPIEEILEELDEMQQAQAQAAQQAMQMQAQQEMQKQALSLEKQRLQNESVEKQVAIKAATSLAKGGGR
jgi:formate dehydrogenase maturation protein FdhE